MPRQIFLCLLILIAVVIVTTGSCSNSGSSPQPKADSGSNSTGVANRGALIFSAAASTKEVAESLAKKFHEKTGVEVKVNLGSSNGLATQIIAGAGADLFLSANERWADEVEKGGQAEAVARLLTNRLVMVVPVENASGVKEPIDLLSPKVKRIALAGEKVPAGMYADQALTKLGLLDKLVAEQKVVRGQDVRATLSYVARGEAEAGIVYSTDAAVASGIRVVHEFDSSLHDPIVYVLVWLKHGSADPRAKDFYGFLQSPSADSTYEEHGFSRLRAN